MKQAGFWILIALGLFLTIGGLVASKYNLLDFLLNPAGVLGVILLVWASFIKRQKNKQG